MYCCSCAWVLFGGDVCTVDVVDVPRCLFVMYVLLMCTVLWNPEASASGNCWQQNVQELILRVSLKYVFSGSRCPIWTPNHNLTEKHHQHHSAI